jgi:hypothetical protein
MIAAVRCALGVFAILTPLLCGEPMGAFSLNHAVCGLAILGVSLASRRRTSGRLLHVPLAVWIGGAPFLLRCGDISLYADLFTGHMLLLFALPTPEMFDP